MEKGSLRCDLNVSIAPILDCFETADTLDFDVLRYLTEIRCNRTGLPRDTGHRVEVKNLNSLRQITAATEYEALRQSASSLNNNPTGRETRTFIVKPVSSQYPLGGETFCIRSKGDAVDYRFMPEPDLPPLVLDGPTLGYDDEVNSLEKYIRDIMPESLEEAAARLSKVYKLNDEVIRVITGDPLAIALLDESVDIAKNELSNLMRTDDEKLPIGDKIDSIPTLTANWLCNDLFALVKRSALGGKDGTSGTNDDELSSTLIHPISVEYSTVDGKRLGSLIAMLVHGSITTSMAKKILSIMYKDDMVSTPQEIAKVNKYQVISNTNALVELCESVVFHPKNASQLDQYKIGGKNVWKIEKYFVGKIMEQSGGNAHPEKMKEALSLILSRI
jgi:aspartyl-tRNA(Asn)/glutamyl-tRNA(Gln) amidotransferase subunit B